MGQTGSVLISEKTNIPEVRNMRHSGSQVRHGAAVGVAVCQIIHVEVDPGECGAQVFAKC